MESLSVKKIVIEKFNETGGTAVIPLMKINLTFRATYNKEGVEVSNLGSQSFL